MICFVAAFQAEAAPVLKHYGFTIFQGSPFPIYKSEIGFLMISGMGKKAAVEAVTRLSGLCPAESIWMNVGIGGRQDSELGDAFLAHKIVDLETGKNWYPQILFSPACKTATVVTVDRCETQYAGDAVYDMEAAGFYEAAAHFSTAELIHSFKVISDNAASPAAQVSPKLAETLIEKNINILDHVINELILIKKELPIREPELLEWFLGRWHFTVTQQHQLKRKLLRLQTLEFFKMSSPNVFVGDLDSRFRGNDNAKKVLNFLDHQITALPVQL